MAAEEQELRLTVTLDDQAAAGLANLKAALQGLQQTGQQSQQSLQQGMERTRRHTREAKEGVQELDFGIAAIARTAGFVGGVFGAIGSEVGKFGTQLFASATDIKGYADAVTRLNQQAYATGQSAAVLKSNIATMTEAGVPAEQATQQLQNFSQAMADLQRSGRSQTREGLLQGLHRPEDIRNMLSFINQLRSARSEEERLNLVRQASLNIRQNLLDQGKSEQYAAERQLAFETRFGVPGITKAKPFEAPTPEQEAYERQRAEGAKLFAESMNSVADSTARVAQALAAMIVDLGGAGEGARQFAEFMKTTAQATETTYQIFLKLHEPLPDPSARHKEQEERLKKFQEEQAKQDAARPPLTEAEKLERDKRLMEIYSGGGAQPTTRQQEAEAARQRYRELREPEYGVGPTGPVQPPTDLLGAAAAPFSSYIRSLIGLPNLEAPGGIVWPEPPQPAPPAPAQPETRPPGPPLVSQALPAPVPVAPQTAVPPETWIPAPRAAAPPAAAEAAAIPEAWIPAPRAPAAAIAEPVPPEPPPRLPAATLTPSMLDSFFNLFRAQPQPDLAAQAGAGNLPAATAPATAPAGAGNLPAATAPATAPAPFAALLPQPTEEVPPSRVPSPQFLATAPLSPDIEDRRREAPLTQAMVDELVRMNAIGTRPQPVAEPIGPVRTRMDGLAPGLGDAAGMIRPVINVAPPEAPPQQRQIEITREQPHYPDWLVGAQAPRERGREEDGRARAFDDVQRKGMQANWLSSLGPDMAAVREAATRDVNVTGTGKISVDVNAPSGTNVRAQGEGLFKTVEINRMTQMMPTEFGPIPMTGVGAGEGSY